MRRAATLTLFLLAASCWLAAGPGGVTVQALIACRHQATHQPHGGHTPAPTDGPCFCDEMSGGSDLAVSPAVPAPVALPSVTDAPSVSWPYVSRLAPPASRTLTPVPPPPIPLA